MIAQLMDAAETTKEIQSVTTVTLSNERQARDLVIFPDNS